MDAGFLRFLVVVGFLPDVFISVSYATMVPQAFFQTLGTLPAIASVIAIV